MKRNRKAKILSTLGPSSSSPEVIEALFNEGCDVFRLNFSHGSIEDHRKNCQVIRNLEKKYNHATCILADLQGPKLRIGIFKDDKIQLKKGQGFTLDLITTPGDQTRVNFPHPDIYDILTPNTEILVNDGRVKLQVLEQSKDELKTEVLNDGVISNNKGINIPGIILPISSLTTKDKSDLSKAIEMGVDWVALSFVQTSKDIVELRKIVSNNVSVMAKIEKPSAVKNIDDILDTSDGVMIARGDLGVELPTEKVPVIQKNIINRCRDFGKPVVVATQMLESMTDHYAPTRAEASDVANAIYDGADAVMLSGESAIGQYPIESVITMNKIIESVEMDRNNFDLEIHEEKIRQKTISTTDAITSAAYTVARNAEAKAVVTFSVSGNTALRMAKERAPVLGIGLSPNIKTARKLQLVWGVHSCHTKDARNTTEMVQIACSVIKEKKLGLPGDTVVITAGVPFGNAGSTNLLRIAKIIDDKNLT